MRLNAKLLFWKAMLGGSQEAPTLMSWTDYHLCQRTGTGSHIILQASDVKYELVIWEATAGPITHFWS